MKILLIVAALVGQNAFADVVRTEERFGGRVIVTTVGKAASIMADSFEGEFSAATQNNSSGPSHLYAKKVDLGSDLGLKCYQQVSEGKISELCEFTFIRNLNYMEERIPQVKTLNIVNELVAENVFNKMNVEEVDGVKTLALGEAKFKITCQKKDDEKHNCNITAQ